MIVRHVRLNLRHSFERAIQDFQKTEARLIYLKKGLTIWRRIANNEIIDIDELFEIIFNKIFPIPYRIQTYLFFSDLHNNKNT